MIDNSIEVTGGHWLEKNNTLTVIPHTGSKPRDDVDVDFTVDKIVDFLILSFPADTMRKLTRALMSEYPTLGA